MNTIIKKIEENNIDLKVIEQAANILKNGGLVAFPTETVYGLGADALDYNAANNIYTAKGRPSDNPLIVHISKEYNLNSLVKEIPEKAKILINKFWPGPLTIVFNKNSNIPDNITGGLDTVAIRIPSNAIAYKIIEKAGIPIAAPSANTSTRPSPTSAEHVIEDLNGKIDMIIDGGTVSIGLESTVIDITTDVPIILRPGYITKDMIEIAIGKVEIDKGLLYNNAKVIPRSPGMKYKHYAPKGEILIIDGDLLEVTETINTIARKRITEGFKVGIIATEQTYPYYKEGIIKNIGSRKNKEEIAKRLFAVLREFDTLKID